MKRKLMRLRIGYLRFFLSIWVSVLRIRKNLLLLHREKRLQPKHLVLPIMFGQLIILAIAIQFEITRAFTIAVIGNLIMVGIAIFPAALHKT